MQTNFKQLVLNPQEVEDVAHTLSQIETGMLANLYQKPYHMRALNTLFVVKILRSR